MVVLARPVGRVPNGVHISCTARVAFDSYDITLGDSVVQVDEELSIGEKLGVDLTQARFWDGEISRAMPIDRVKLERHCIQLEGRSSSDQLVERRIARFAEALGGALANEREALPETVVSSIIGLGQGATPTGDDILLGALAFLDAMGAAVDSPLRDTVDRLITEMPLATTGISLALLRAAIAGQHAELTGDLVKAVVVGGTHDVACAIGRIEAVGATSGRDTVRGVAIAIRSVLGQSAKSSVLESTSVI